MADFTLDTSTLGGGSFITQPFPMSGEFREIQFQWTQAGSGQDAESHFLEFHFIPIGIVEATSV